ncbi:MAG: TolC family protein, partial [Ginsengibacter sp.]
METSKYKCSMGNVQFLMKGRNIRKSFNIKHSTFNIILLFIIGLLLNTRLNAQQRILTLKQAINEALKNNGIIKSANYTIDLQRALRRSAVNIDKTNIILSQGQVNSINYDNHLNITQRFEYPTVYKNQLRLADERIKGSQYQLAVNQLDLANSVKTAYYEFVYYINKRQLLYAQDTLYSNLVKASTVRYRTGESTLLEKATSETASFEIKNQIQQNEIDITIAQQQLQVLLNTKDAVMVAD